MAVMLNMMQIDPKPITVASNTNKKVSGKLESDFAKKLDVATEKNDADSDAKVKNDDSLQLMAGMAGIIAPIIINPVPSTAAAGVDTTSLVVNDDAKAQIVVAGQDSEQLQLENIVSNIIQAQQLVATVPSAEKTQLVTAVKTVDQAQLKTVDAEKLTSTLGVQTELVDPNNVLAKLTDLLSNKSQAKIPTASLPSQNSAPQNATVSTPLDSKQIVEALLQNQSQSQLQTQAQIQSPISEKNQIAEIQAKIPEILASNPLMVKKVADTSLASNIDNLNKNTTKQVDNKKNLDISANIEAVTTLDIPRLVDTLNVKPVLVSEVTPVTLNTLPAASKEQVESILTNNNDKDSNVFTNLLNQQVLRSDNQTNVDIKPVNPQPVADTYNITSQIVDQARLVAGNKNTEMIIKLKPEHLGELTFKVSIENGVVSASFHSNNSEVRNVIESTLYQLKQEMATQGLKVDNVGVYAGLGEFFSNGQQSRSNQQQTVKVQKKNADEEFLEAFDATEAVGKISDATGVDYRA